MNNVPLIILDRDGVINIDSVDYIKSPQEWNPLPNSLEAIALLNAHHYKVVIATNQSGIGRGLYDHATLTLIHKKMHQALAQKGGKIDAIFYCPHPPETQCTCRKPQPGLLLQIAHAYNTSLQPIPFVGDSLRDLKAAMAAGAQPVLVLTGNGKKTLTQNPQLQVPQFEDLYSFAQYYVKNTSTL